ncbi:RNase adapter RapZ [Marinivivus vitaminiproducens]|uniref:RNase adapter RapZ n=1 Tax=Marinivivus vitaminiproducens TaxID=3035935 RepID=UPI0027AB2609|nr:RNase adapter RapZ [Geminicoccaceae bacterium SCSIO 64248]
MTDGASTTLIVSGLAGAGRSTALKALEDLGYEAVDNLPLTLLPTLLRREADPERPLAVGIDARSRAFEPDRLIAAIEAQRSDARTRLKLVYLDCDDDVLVKRFTETRRRHPLAVDRPIADGIGSERRLLSPLRDSADHVIDTTLLSSNDLRRLLAGHFDPARARRLLISILSFSFRRGLPREADLVFDVRFLRNPYYDETLRPLTGRDPAVRAHVESDPHFALFFMQVTDLLLGLLPRYQAEGKSYLTIAFGCTGGRHRSIAISDAVGERLVASGWLADVRHRDTLVPERLELPTNNREPVV